MARSTEIIDNETLAMFNAMQDAIQADEICKGIRTVCANASKEIDEQGAFVIRVSFQTTEDRTIKTFDTGTYAGRTLKALAELWNVALPATEEEAKGFMAKLNKAMADETRDIMFYGFAYKNSVGESKEMQKFRRPTAIDRGRAIHEQQESEAK